MSAGWASPSSRGLCDALLPSTRCETLRPSGAARQGTPAWTVCYHLHRRRHSPRCGRRASDSRRVLSPAPTSPARVRSLGWTTGGKHSAAWEPSSRRAAERGATRDDAVGPLLSLPVAYKFNSNAPQSYFLIGCGYLAVAGDASGECLTPVRGYRSFGLCTFGAQQVAEIRGSPQLYSMGPP